VRKIIESAGEDDARAGPFRLYRNGKTTFVEETTAKARAWRADAGE
jgi:hypothetical protein